MNNMKLFTDIGFIASLCTITCKTHALYKHCIQDCKALKKKDKVDLYTVTYELYLLQLFISIKKTVSKKTKNRSQVPCALSSMSSRKIHKLPPSGLHASNLISNVHRFDCTIKQTEALCF